MVCLLYTFIQIYDFRNYSCQTILMIIKAITMRIDSYCSINQQFKMQQTYLRSQKMKYDEKIYNEWVVLPPNLPVPNQPTLLSLGITFHKLIYLNQINEGNCGIELGLEWWGLANAHQVNYYKDAEEQCVASYLVCCPFDKLLTYLCDMKLLGIQMKINKRVIGKAYLNFLLLKGWKGEKIQQFLDIKHNNKKIGQMTYSIQISTINNPYLNTSPETTAKQPSNTGRYYQANSVHSLGVQLKTKTNIPSMHKTPSIEPVHTQTHGMVRHSQKIVSFHEENNHEYSISLPKNSSNTIQIDQTSPRNDRILEEDRSQQRHRHNYDAELVRLVQDYNLLFGKQSIGTLIQHNVQNIVEIEVVKLDLGKQTVAQIEVSVPLIGGTKNIYKIGEKGFIKFMVSGENNKQLINYLKTATIEFKCNGKFEGSAKLSKILSKHGQMIQVALFQRQNKKQLSKKPKGICWIKIVPPPTTQQSTNKQKNQILKQQIAAPVKEQYALFVLKKYNSINKYRRTINYFIRISQQNKQLANSATIWNCQADPQFNETITCKITSTNISFQLFQRHQNSIKIGEGLLMISGPIGINVEIQINSKNYGSEIAIGYLTVDFVKNGLESVTKMIGILQNKQNINANYLNARKQNQSAKFEQPKQIKIEPYVAQVQQNNEIQILQNYPQKIEDSQQDQNNDKKQKQYKPEPLRPISLPQKDLSILQVHSALFTYLYSNSHIIEQMKQHNVLKITQFIDLMQPVRDSHIVSHRQINNLISKYLLSGRNAQNVNKFNVTAFTDSFDAFCTYYLQAVQDKDQLLRQLLLILDQQGITINGLEHQLKNSRNLWSKLNDLLSFNKGNNVNIVQYLREHFQPTKQSCFTTAAKLCDTLRKFQVFQTTTGTQIMPNKLSDLVYTNLCSLLVDLQPDIQLYTYPTLIQLMNNQDIILSTWELLCLENQMGNQIRKQINFGKYEQQLHDYKEQLKKNKLNDQPKQLQSDRPTISKSPTFGYLHQPQLIKPQQNTSNMVDSLALKLHNIAISPINYNSNQTNQSQLKAIFSNLKYQPIDLYIGDMRVDIRQEDEVSREYVSVQQVSQQNYSSSKSGQHGQYERGRRSPEFDMSLKQDIQGLRKNEEVRSLSSEQKMFQILLHNVDKKFTYTVEIYFAQQKTAIQLQSIYNEWTAIVSEDGDYLGAILIY